MGLPSEEARKAIGPGGQRWSGKVRLAFVCDDRVVLRAAAVDGLGAVLLPAFLGDAEPALQRVLPEWHFGRVPLHAVWLPEARHDRRVRAVVDAVTAWSRAQAC